MVTKIKRWGNSHGIIIPKTLLAKMDIDDPENQSVVLSVNQKKELIISKNQEVSDLAQLFEGFDLSAYEKEYGKQSEKLNGKLAGQELL